MRIGIILGCVSVSLIVIASALSGSAWWWTANPPPGGDHSSYAGQQVDGDGRAKETDDIESFYSCGFWTGGSQGNPENITLQQGQKCVWTIYYELEAELTPQTDLDGARSELHAYLYYLNNGQWTMVDNDWDIAQTLVKGQYIGKSGYLHLHHSNHQYAAGDNYKVYLNLTCGYLDGAVWTNHMSHFATAYYIIR